MPRPILATIHTEALRHNLARMRRAAPDARVWAVVKANAYGHGIERVYEALRGADGFALLDLQEAERVRALGWRGPILLLEGAFEPRDLELCSRLQLWHVVHCEQQIDWLAAHKTQQPHRVFLKLNSGMNRLGFAPPSLPRRLRAAASAAAGRRNLLRHAFLAMPTASAASPTRRAPSPRPRATCRASARWPTAPPTLRHARDPAVRADWIRPGIAVYGSAPDFPEHDIAHWDLQPTMTLASRLIGVQQLQPGDTVGYGSRFIADAAMRVGVVACGYADGYPRHCGTGTPVLVEGVRTQLLGRVSMDMLAVDLSPLPQAGFGSEVTLWGRASNGAVLPIDEVAQAAGTLGYELMCAVAPRVPVVVG